VLSANHIKGPYKLLVSNDPTSRSMGELMQAELANVGVNLTVDVVTGPDAIALFNKGQYDFSLNYFSYCDPDILYLFFAPGETGVIYTNPQLTKALVGGRSTNNKAVMQADYTTAQRLLMTSGLIDPLFSPIDYYGLNNRIHGWHINYFTLGYTVVPMWQDIWVSH
jgi:ABC-type transport system substrate-binding protein